MVLDKTHANHASFIPTLATTPINVDVLHQELHAHPDLDFVTDLINGLREGFHTGMHSVPSATFECTNLLSARTQPHVVQDIIEQEKQKGFLIGPFHSAPYPIYRVNPIGIVEGKYSRKKRLIVDLSAPHNNQEHSSLNSLINKHEFSMKYVKIDDAIKKIKTAGIGAWLCKFDICDAFKLIPIHPSLWPYHGIKWNNQYYFYVRLVFGSRSSPKIFTKLSEAISWIAVNNYGIETLLYLLDDFLTIDHPQHMADRTMAIMTMLFARLGIPLSPLKTLGPTTCLDYLGVTLNTLTMQARLPEDKIDRIRNLLTQFIKIKSVTKRELLSLLGHLNFACRVNVPGRTFVSYLLQISTSVRELHHHIHISRECQKDLQMWSTFLNQWNGISLFYNDAISDSSDMELYTDASGSIGFGGYFRGRWFAEPWPEELHPLLDHKLSIAFCELYPIVVAAVLWGQEWRQKKILFHCDNATTVAIIKKGRSKSPDIMKLMRRLTWTAATNGFIIYAEHIPGKKNAIADALSRLQITRFRQLAPTAEHQPCACPPPARLLLI